MKSLTIACANMLGWASAQLALALEQEEQLRLERVAGACRA